MSTEASAVRNSGYVYLDKYGVLHVTTAKETADNAHAD